MQILYKAMDSAVIAFSGGVRLACNPSVSSDNAGQ